MIHGCQEHQQLVVPLSHDHELLKCWLSVFWDEDCALVHDEAMYASEIRALLILEVNNSEKYSVTLWHRLALEGVHTAQSPTHRPQARCSVRYACARHRRLHRRSSASLMSFIPRDIIEIDCSLE